MRATERGAVIRRGVGYRGNQTAEVLLPEGFHGPVDRLPVDLLRFLARTGHGPLHDHGHGNPFPVRGVEFIDGFIAFPQLLHHLHTRIVVRGETARKLDAETVPGQSLTHPEEIGIGRRPGSEERRIVTDPVRTPEGGDDRGRKHLDEEILGAAFLQAEQFRRQIDGLGRKFFNGDDVDVLFRGIFPARFVDGAAVGVVVGQQSHLRRFLALVDGEDVVEDGLAIQAVTPEGQVHVFDRRLENLPSWWNS